MKPLGLSVLIFGVSGGSARTRPVSQQLSISIVKAALLQGASESHPLPILTELDRITDDYNANQIEMDQAAANLRTAICRDKRATLAEVLYATDQDASLIGVKVMLLGSFDDIVTGILDCACNIDPVSILVPYRNLVFLKKCEGLGSDGTVSCDANVQMETFKADVLTLMGPTVLCKSSCRQALGTIIDKIYGVLKLGISGRLILKRLPYPIGRESLDCACGNGKFPAFDFDTLLNTALAPFSRNGTFNTSSTQVELASPAYRKRLLEVVYGPRGLCSGSCSNIWKDVEVIYDVGSVYNQKLHWRDGPLASLPGPSELGSRTYGELMSCTTPHPPSTDASSGCPGGSIIDCIGLCPSIPAEAYRACVESCATRCSTSVSKVEHAEASWFVFRTGPTTTFYLVLSAVLVLVTAAVSMLRTPIRVL